MKIYNFLQFLRLMFQIWHKENWATPWSGKYTSWWEAFQCAKIVWLDNTV